MLDKLYNMQRFSTAKMTALFKSVREKIVHWPHLSAPSQNSNVHPRRILILWFLTLSDEQTEDISNSC